MQGVRPGTHKYYTKSKSPEVPTFNNEERIRHEILFFSQGPIDGLLPGEKARELFIRSKLPLQILSQVWNLVDHPHDNMLDATEFSWAVHLLQWYMGGHRLPAAIPALTSGHARPPEITVKLMKKRELSAYRKLFEVLDQNRKGVLNAPSVREVLWTSGLPRPVLAHIWNLSDVDRDGQLTVDEFCIACHLIRFCKTGAVLSGPVNVFSLLPHKMLKTDLAAKKSKMAELEATKKRLMALKERRKKEATRESQRVELWRERLKILRMRHQALREAGDLDDDLVVCHDNQQTAHVEAQVYKMEAVAQKLKKEHERVRQETAHVIIEEQKLSQEVTQLEQEAEALQERRKRNSIIKDLDPFHQLYEERKEERLTGIVTPKKKKVPTATLR